MDVSQLLGESGGRGAEGLFFWGGENGAGRCREMRISSCSLCACAEAHREDLDIDLLVLIVQEAPYGEEVGQGGGCSLYKRDSR